MDEIREALKAAGLEHMEDDVLLDMGLIEATAVAETVIERRRNGKKEYLHRIHDRKGQDSERQNRS